jgi:asparagine synthase (glutamine-hydrolysing)
MCGITGIYLKEGKVDSRLLKRMTDTLKKRGPDDEGYFVRDKIGLGMRRLSIIDLETGNQPMKNEDGSVWVIFNGEIYNFKEIREKLQEKNHEFVTNSDTEVLVHLYEEHGEDMVKHLNGMFAFAIWDERKKRLLLVRDRLGIKPLYYYHDENRFVFASEIKSIIEDRTIKREVDLEALHYYIGYEYVPAPLTMYKGINKLEAGNMLIVEDNEIKSKQYWDVKFKPQDKDENYFIEKLIELLKDSIEKRLIADVPLGVFLSGGVDSSLLVALMSEVTKEKIKTFSVGFKDQSYNELDEARLIAGKYKTDHHEITLEPDILGLIDKMTSYLDEPYADTSAIPVFLISNKTRANIKVALSGDGGDELFAGYDRYLASKLDKIYSKLPAIVRDGILEASEALRPRSQKKGMINITKRFLEGSSLPKHGQHIRWQYSLQRGEEHNLYSKYALEHVKNLDNFRLIDKFYRKLKTDDRLAKEQYVDLKTYLADAMLVKIDRMSMANSLEVRVPYLDHRLVEFAFTIPSNLKMKGFTLKYILKKAAQKYLPKEILKKQKQGFSIPVKNWLKNEIKQYAKEILLGEYEGLKYFDQKYIKTMLIEHTRKRKDHSHKLWAIMIFVLWHRKYIEK